jgi:hypothetical protein
MLYPCMGVCDDSNWIACVNIRECCGLGRCHEGCAGSETRFSWISFSALSEMENVSTLFEDGIWNNSFELKYTVVVVICV